MAVDLIVLSPDIVNGMEREEEDYSLKSITESGGEQRVQKFTRPVWTMPYEAMQYAEFVALWVFYKLRGGCARGFLIWDPIALYTASAQAIGTGDGTTTSFQLTNTITDGLLSATFNVLHPVPTGTAIPSQYQGVAGTGATTTLMKVWVNGVLKTEGSDYAFSPSTGIVTFASAPGNTLSITAQFWFYTTVRFDGPLPLKLDSIYAETSVKLIGLLYE